MNTPGGKITRTMLLALLLPLLPAGVNAKVFRFAVVGDTQPGGYLYMRSPEVWNRIIADIKRQKPDLIIQTGDHVYGYQGNESELRRMWKRYFAAIEPLKGIPFHHAPGNHDLYDAMSGKVWDGFFGRRYHSVEFGRNAFIFLDGETDTNRISGAQLVWLKERLKRYRGYDNIFVSMHKPVFRPMVGDKMYGDDASLDTHPEEYRKFRDLLAKSGVKIVFAGHYHQYDMDYRDGILQFISGGGGGELEDDPVRGFHHYLLVEVDGKKVDVRPVRITDTDWVDPVVERKAPFMLEDFEAADSPYAWAMWDQGVAGEAIPAPAGMTGRVFRMKYNLASYEWPLLTIGLEHPEKWDGAKAISFDLFFPAQPGNLPIPPVTLSIQGLSRSYGVNTAGLKEGWNRVTFRFADPVWSYEEGKQRKEKSILELPRAGSITGVSFMVWGYERKDAGEIELDNVRVE